MAPNIRRAAIVTKKENSEAEDAGTRVARLLIKNMVKTYTGLPLKIDGATPVKEEELKDVELDLVFAIGGDGTTLRAFRIMPNKVPLFSINSGGHRGILAEAGADSIEYAIRAIL